jgi:hypothetical protein
VTGAPRRNGQCAEMADNMSSGDLTPRLLDGFDRTRVLLRNEYQTKGT